MPQYCYKCSKCGMVFHYLDSIACRNNPKECPGCTAPALRDAESELAGHVDAIERTRYSHSMGVNPEQIPEAMKAYPGSEYLPDGRLVIHSRQQKLFEAKRRGMEEI